MVLVIGGIASGKRTYVRSLGYEDDHMSARAASPAPVLLALEESLRPGELDEQTLAQVLAKEVVVCAEVGMGVVPIDAEQRAWRERVGRTCALLAAQATRVVRLVCGIPVTIKDTGGES
ncbi:MAG: bifunctional adenosylcobinamide kinase/adenosylcobinamide-phosphate guanylyltransferase [Coriobacteriales bacterium]|nr:bifunctional adenosylcobinamide kinase/adenosylcobinamide-phosphate guanylyltransferase [Coriobacteriales bacterium]